MSALKKLLITNNSLKNIAGSEIVVLEVVEDFLRRGWHVDVYTNELSSPIIDEFNELPQQAEQLRLIWESDFSFAERYDLIWLHHGALPPSVIRSFAESEENPTPLFWHHLSALENNFVEQPLLVEIEQKLANVIGAISLETKEQVCSYGIEPAKVRVFDNPAPDRFADAPVELDPQKLEKLLMVSNHPPDEVLKAREILENQGYQCDFLGQSGAKRLLPEILRDYQGVITIGKTVQYALSMGIPCYIYDHFGGDGWLTEENFAINAQFNFSGRNAYRKLSAETLSEEIVHGFAGACQFSQRKRPELSTHYRLSRQIDALLQNPRLAVPKIKKLSAGEIKQFIQFTLYQRSNHLAMVDVAVHHRYLESDLQRTREEKMVTEGERFELAQLLEIFQREHKRLAGKKETLEASLKTSQDEIKRLRRAIDDWNGQTWLSRALHKMRVSKQEPDV